MALAQSTPRERVRYGISKARHRHIRGGVDELAAVLDQRAHYRAGVLRRAGVGGVEDGGGAQTDGG
jgi:hypothetical protein